MQHSWGRKRSDGGNGEEEDDDDGKPKEEKIFALSGGLAVASSVRHTFVGLRTACLLAFTLSGGLAVSYSSASYIGIRRAGYAHLTTDAAETRSLIPSHSYNPPHKSKPIRLTED
jgi:hypothetical protein